MMENYKWLVHTVVWVSLVGMIVAGCATGEMVMPEVGTEVAVGETVTKTFTVTFEEPTRTVVDIDSETGDGTVKWVAGDAISILYGNNNERVELSVSDISDDGKTASITFDVKPEVNYCAVYPYNSKYRYSSKDNLSIYIPSVQDGTFGGCHISSGDFTSESSSITFKNVSNILVFEQSSSDIARVTLEDNRGYSLMSDAAVVEVTTGKTGRFFLGLPNCYLLDGFTIRAFDDSGTCTGMAYSAKKLVISDGGEGVDLGTLEDHIVPVLSVSGFLSAANEAQYIVIGVVSVVSGSGCSLSDGTGSLWIPSISGVSSLSVGDLLTVCCSKYGDAVDSASCLFQKSNGSLLGQSLYGFYPAMGGSAYHEYDIFLDQIGVSEGSFRIVSPSTSKWVSVTGLPSDPSVGGTYTVQIDQNYSTGLPAFFSTDVTVVQVENDASSLKPARMVWLVMSDGRGLVVRINQSSL